MIDWKQDLGCWHEFCSYLQSYVSSYINFFLWACSHPFFSEDRFSNIFYKQDPSIFDLEWQPRFQNLKIFDSREDWELIRISVSQFQILSIESIDSVPQNKCVLLVQSTVARSANHMKRGPPVGRMRRLSENRVESTRPHIYNRCKRYHKLHF